MSTEVWVGPRAPETRRCAMLPCPDAAAAGFIFCRTHLANPHGTDYYRCTSCGRSAFRVDVNGWCANCRVAEIDAHTVVQTIDGSWWVVRHSMTVDPTPYSTRSQALAARTTHLLARGFGTAART